MPHSSHPRPGRRRLASLIAASTLGAALVPVLFAAQPAAATPPPCVPDGYTAASSADLFKLTLLDAGVIGLVPGPVANVTIGHATADMAQATPDHATGKADYLSATIAGITVPPSLLNTHAQQDAPPAHTTADSHSLIALNSGLLKLGVGNVSAFAGQAGPYTCGLATGDASIVDATVLPGLNGHSLLSLPENLNGKAGAGIITSGGHLASGAGADIGLAELHVFAGTRAEIGVKVVTEPTLKGVATGTTATSFVTYTSPVLSLTLPGLPPVTLDSVHTSVDVVTSADAGAVTGLLSSLNLPAVNNLPVLAKKQLELRLTLGDVTKHVSGTHVHGDAATLRVQLLLVPAETTQGIAPHAVSGATTLLDLGLGVLSVDATAPKASTSTPAPCSSSPDRGYGDDQGYGYGCPSTHPACTCTTPPSSPTPTPTGHPSSGATTPVATPTPTTTVKATSGGGSLPVTGANTGWFIGAGVALLLIGRLILVATRRRMAG